MRRGLALAAEGRRSSTSVANRRPPRSGPHRSGRGECTDRPGGEELACHGVTVSIDTMHAAVARAALENGASIVNDVSGGRADPSMAPLVAEAGVPWVLMHWRWVHSDSVHDPHAIPNYRDVVTDVRDELYGLR